MKATKPLKGRCDCWKRAGTKWEELSPVRIHRFRIRCLRCKKFMMWGTVAQILEVRASGAKMKVIPYRPIM